MSEEAVESVRIAYVTEYDASQVRHWSGTGYYMAEALRRQGLTVELVGPLRMPLRTFFRLKRQVYRFCLRQSHLPNREPLVLRSYARQVATRLQGLAVDVVFSPSPISIAYLDCPQPIVFWHDATFAGLHDFYPRYSLSLIHI